MINIKAPANRAYFQPYDFGLINFNYPTTLLATTTNSSTTLVVPTTDLSAGMILSGSGIPSGTKVASIIDDTHCVMDHAATASATIFLSVQLPTTQIDEIILCDGTDVDQNQIVFIKRYNTWLIYTHLRGGNFKYNLLFLSYDRTKQIAYTATNTIVILTRS
jgi:hypothetical protein